MTIAVKEQTQETQTGTGSVLMEWFRDPDYVKAKETLEQTQQMIADLQKKRKTIESRLGELGDDRTDGLIKQTRVNVAAKRAKPSEVDALKKEKEKLEEDLLQAEADLMITDEEFKECENRFNAAHRRAETQGKLEIISLEISRLEKLVNTAQRFVELQNSRRELLYFAERCFSVSTDGHKDKGGLLDHFVLNGSDEAKTLEWWINKQAEVLRYYRAKGEEYRNKLQ